MKLRIFIFDLDKSLRDLVAIIARNKGHEVLAFPEPSACPIYSAQDCTCPQNHACGDLMIIDSRMLKMSTIDFIRKQIDSGCKGATQNKLILSTTGSNEEELQAAEEIGFRLMRKPFKVEDISDWIDECEKRINPDRELAELNLE